MRGKFRKSLLVIIGGMLLIGGTSSISRDSLISDNNEQEKEVIDPFYYETKEIYVCFTDGRCELYRYDTEEQVIQALNDLRHRDDVEFYQPNYRYYNTATYITDMNYKEQWAFHNDGTFVVKSESEIDDSKKQNENHTVFTESMDQVWKDWYQSISGLNISLMDMTQTEHDSSIESGKAKKGIDIAMEDAWDSYKGGVREPTK